MAGEAGAHDYEVGIDAGVAPAGHTRTQSTTAGELSIRGPSGASSFVEKVSRKGVANGYASLDGSAVVPDAQVSETSVTQHEAALAITAAQITDQSAIAAVAEGAVTAHEAALSIAASQVTGDLPATQVDGPAITAVGATHTFAAADNGKCLHVDDGTALEVSLPATGPGAGDLLLICCTSTGNLSFAGAGTIHFDSVSYAAGPVATGKYLVSVLCVATGVYYISGELDLA